MHKRPLGEVITTLRDAAIVTVVCSVAALAVNAARPDGIPLVQREGYEIIVPCPEPLGDPGRMGPLQLLRMKEERTLVIDARSREEFVAWHLPRAINVPFDYLMPVDPKRLKQIASSGARKVVVYGDGGDPDSGHQLARELSGSGIKNVYYVAGGAPLLREAAGRAKP